MEAYDIAMIGAGYNGLVCAAYLLKAGYKCSTTGETLNFQGGASEVFN